MGIQVGKILGVCVAALAVTISLAGCATANTTELEKRGFTDITESSFDENNDLYGGDIGTYFANAGDECRVVLQYTELPDIPGTEWVLVEKSSKGEDSDVYLPNPTAEKVGVLDAFQYCYDIDEAPPSDE